MCVLRGHCPAREMSSSLVSIDVEAASLAFRVPASDAVDAACRHVEFLHSESASSSQA